MIIANHSFAGPDSSRPGVLLPVVCSLPISQFSSPLRRPIPERINFRHFRLLLRCIVKNIFQSALMPLSAQRQ